MTRSTQVHVREARPDEHDALGRLIVSAYAALLEDALPPDYAAELADVAGRADRSVLLVAEAADGTLAGGVTYVPGPGELAFVDAPPDEAAIRMLAVAPTAQRQGVGTALVEACIDLARQAGRTHVALHTTEWMTTGMRIYERLGFRRVPERDRNLPGFCLLTYVLDLEPTSDTAHQGA